MSGYEKNEPEEKKPCLVGGSDTESPSEVAPQAELQPINWKFVGIGAVVGIVCFFSGWMSKTLYSDLSGSDSAQSAKLEILEAFSALAVARESIGEHKIVQEAELRLLRSLQEHQSAYNFADRGESRTTGIEPVGPRIVFPDGYELLLPESLANELRD